MMQPKIASTAFGQITIGKTAYEHDVIINLDGQVKKRKKKLSKAVYGTSHIISRDEAKYIYEKGAKQVLIGSGQYGKVTLSDDACMFFEKKKCGVKILTTPEAAEFWNVNGGPEMIGLFHITC